MNTITHEPQSTPVEKEVTIKVCDAIMGSGKTTAAINMMNSNPSQRYIYVTPLLDEDLRITKACRAMKFARPGFVGLTTRRTTNGVKSDDILRLLKKGRNIATTHVLYQMFTPEMYALAKEKEYVIVIDEEPEVVENCRYKASDFEALCNLGYIRRENYGDVTVLKDDYSGVLRGLIDAAKTHKLMTISDSDTPKKMWTIAPELFGSFKEVYFLTYMFPGSVLSYYIRAHHLNFEYIYVNHTADDVYEFVDHPCYLPAYLQSLSEKIHICEDEKLNAIGDAKTALSASWFKRHGWKGTKTAKQLKSNLRVYFTEYTGDIHGSLRMWTVFSDYKKDFMRNGWTSGYVAFNKKSTNEYSDRRNLAYLCNVFLHPDIAHYATHHGVTVDEDQYATSMLVQWIWRSAIRNGEEIWLYLPSSRMRQFLKEWMAHVAQEYAQFMDSKQSISIVGGSDHE